MDYRKISDLTQRMQHAVVVAKRYEETGDDVPEKLQHYIVDLGYWICTYANFDPTGESWVV
jgi:hypothetical protein